MRKQILGGILLLFAVGAGVRVAASATRAHAPAESTATAQSRVIEPGVRLGPVEAGSSLASLRAALGSRAVSLEMVLSEDGKKRVSGAVVYPGDSKRRIELAWTDTVAKSMPAWARVRGATDSWRTPAGVHLGTTLLELEKLNGRAFTVESFRSGTRKSRIRSWNKGNLADELEKSAKVWLQLPTSATSAQASAVSQGNLLPSGDPPLRSLNPRVAEIVIRFVHGS